MREVEEVMCVGDAGSGTDDYTKLASEPAVRTVCAGGASFDWSSCGRGAGAHRCSPVSCSGCASQMGGKCRASAFATVCPGLTTVRD